MIKQANRKKAFFYIFVMAKEQQKNIQTHKKMRTKKFRLFWIVLFDGHKNLALFFFRSQYRFTTANDISCLVAINFIFIFFPSSNLPNIMCVCVCVYFNVLGSRFCLESLNFCLYFPCFFWPVDFGWNQPWWWWWW